VQDSGVNGASTVYLIVDDETTYEIAPNSVLSIGRLDSNDVVLDDYKVSREHAVLKFSKSNIMLVDLASTHGSFVNGVRIDRSILHFGDTIKIVSHELVLSRERPESATSNNGSTVTPRAARSLDRRLKFFGGLNEFPLLTLVQFLHQEKQSGLLLLELGQTPGPRLYFQNGDIIHVTQGENLAELLIRKNHEESLFFYFHHETNFPTRTILQSTPNYLMSLCHSHDEKRSRDTEEMQTILSLKSKAATDRVALPTEPLPPVRH
jgi:pSer/pThr/pTyr-binding forkhead associated (FHA) protein